MESNKKIIVSLWLAVMLTGCAHHEIAEQPASASEKQSAVRAYRNCLIPYASRLDDGRSDAKTIAQAMKGACPAEKAAIFETAARGENGAVKQGIFRGMDSVEESTALQVVLAERNSQK